MKPKDGYISTIEASKYCGVTEPTMRNWISKGLVAAYITPGGTAKIPVNKLISSMKNRNMPISKDLISQCRINVLIVDDEPEYLDIMTEALKTKSEYLVQTAHNGYDACIAMGKITPDIVVIDLMMPFVNGVELYKIIKRNALTAHIKIIVVTGFPESSEMQVIKELGAKDIITKPFEPDLFVKTVDKYSILKGVKVA